MCSLRPGVPGVSDNIRVTSIVGRFLEHSRVYWFRNGGDEQVLVGSADLMPRNLNRRVEVLFPVEDPAIVRRLRDEILDVYMHDNVKARYMQADGTYVHAHRRPRARRPSTARPGSSSTPPTGRRARTRPARRAKRRPTGDR